MKKFFLILLAVILILIMAYLTGGRRDRQGVTGALRKSCPDELIHNKMPGPGGAKPSYYIVNGERKEISEYDAAWVAANCNVPEQTVY